MTYVITQPCIDVKNKSCVDVCPVSCIYFESDDKDRKLYIHPDKCTECGACEPECPVNAIFFEGAVPDEWKEFTELDARWWIADQDCCKSSGVAPAVGGILRDLPHGLLRLRPGDLHRSNLLVLQVAQAKSSGAR